MALTAGSVVRRSVYGNRRVVVYDATIASYTTGGESLVPSDVGLTAFDNVQGHAKSVGTNPAWLGYDYTNQKVLAFAGTAQLTATNNVGPCRFTITGN